MKVLVAVTCSAVLAAAGLYFVQTYTDAVAAAETAKAVQFRSFCQTTGRYAEQQPAVARSQCTDIGINF